MARPLQISPPGSTLVLSGGAAERRSGGARVPKPSVLCCSPHGQPSRTSLCTVHGVGNSGLGGASIWGEHVFNTFSHAKHVVRPKDGAFAGSIWGAGAYTGKQ